MTTSTGGAMVVVLLKAFVGLALGTSMITAGAFWISPVLGAITALFAAFLWAFFIAPRLAGQMVAALINYFREKKQGR